MGAPVTLYAPHPVYYTVDAMASVIMRPKQCHPFSMTRMVKWEYSSTLLPIDYIKEY